MSIISKILCCSLLYILLSCGGAEKPDPFIPDPNDTPIVFCESVCDHYYKMMCDEALPTVEGNTCTDVCENLLDSQLPNIDTYYICVLKSDTCEASRKCE